MFKSFLKYICAPLRLVAILFLITTIHVSTVQAMKYTTIDQPTPTTSPSVSPTSNATVTLAIPGSSTLIGQPGTNVQLTGSGFPANAQVSLYVTPTQSQCTVATVSAMQPFSQPNVNADGSGAFSLTSAWPASAATPTTAYYVCAIVPTSAVAVNSSQSFTVAQAPSASITPTTANAGDTVTVAGSNWTAYQAVTVSIGMPNTAPIATQQVSADSNGNFNTTLTIPANAPAGAYSIQAVEASNQNVKFSQDNALTINAAATPTPTATSTPAPTPTVAPTPTPKTTNSGGGSPNLTPIIFGLGGLGVILVIIGITMFISYSNKN